MSDNTRLELRPLGSVIGADVAGVNLAALDTADFAAIERAWHEHLVLRFRDQHLSDAELMDFSHRFGELDRVPIRAAGVLASDDPRVAVAPEARDYVNIISNVRVDGEPIGGLGNYEAHWHTDMSYNDVPPMASVLYGIEVPPEGGNTSFANMYAAYETPDAATKQRIAGLVCIHDASRNSVGELRRGFAEVSDPSQTVGARHPIVRTHPVTRRKCLFLPPATQRLCRRPGGGGQRGTARSAVGARHAAGVLLDPGVARGRCGDLGQSLCAASPRRLQRQLSPGDASHPDLWRQAVLMPPLS